MNMGRDLAKISQKCACKGFVPDKRKVGCKRSQPIHEKCAVVCNVLCKRNQCVVHRAIPCLAHMEQEPDPQPQGTRPPPFSAWPLET
jgi:hypothetical protein